MTYNVLWDQGTNTWASYSNTSTQSVTLTSLSVGDLYGISIAAVNTLGQGPQSTPIYIIAASNPDRMNHVSTSLVSTSVRITWTAPTSNGATIDSYQILILERLSYTFKEFKDVCNGSAALAISNLYCDIPMSYIINNLNYQAGQLIIAKALAHNSIGWSVESLENQAGT